MTHLLAHKCHLVGLLQRVILLLGMALGALEFERQ